MLGAKDEDKLDGKVKASAVAKMVYELLETELNVDRQSEIAFGIVTIIALQNQSFITSEVRFTSQERLGRMNNAKKNFKKQEQAKESNERSSETDVHHVIPVSEDPSKCSDSNNFELKSRQSHKEHHRNEQKEARDLIKNGEKDKG